MTSIAFTGDISFTKYFKDEWHRDDLVDQKLIDFLHSADHVVANVECTMSSRAASGGGQLKHASDPESSRWVEKLGADIWTLANNHILDCGGDGLMDTVELARSLGRKTIGAGANKEEASKPVYIDEAGGIGIFSIVYDRQILRTEADKPSLILWNETERIRRIVEEVKAKCRWCIMVVHGGGEFSQIPLPFVRAFHKSFLKMGVDVIVAHHPHVVQNYERFGKKMVFYSLGNFIFDTDYQRIQKYTDCGMLLKLNFTENDFTFEHQAVQIDRKKQRVVAGDDPAIFQNIGKFEYHLLSALGVKDYVLNNYRSRKFLDKKYESFTRQQWFENNEKLFGTTAARQMDRGPRIAALGLWRLARKELVDYIHKGF